MTENRRNLEIKILERYFPRKYRFANIGESNEYLDVGIKSQSGKVYRISLELFNYPNKKPDAYLTWPENLMGHNGERLAKVSHKLHLLAPKNGNPQICHFKGSTWNPNNTLYQVILKCRIWLEAYEAYVRTGNPIDHYLNNE